MQEKEVIKQGEAFERLFSNADFGVLQECMIIEMGKVGSIILGPDAPDAVIQDFAEYKKQKAIMVGLEMPQSYMKDIVRQMKVFKEEKRLEEEKSARTKRQGQAGT